MSVVDAAAVEEFNSFGPWVMPVDRPSEVPPLFAGHPIDFAEARLVLKFPRPESRRDLVAGMDLYDYLVIVTPARVTVLERNGSVGEFELRELAVISAGADLLDGHLVMQFVTGRSYAMPYNGSSSSTVARLADVIRELVDDATTSGEGRRTPFGMDDLGRNDVGLVSHANELLAAEPRLAVLSAEGRRAVVPRRADLSHWLTPTTLHGFVIATTGSELVILSRKRWLTKGRAPDLSMTRTIVLLGRVDSVTSAGHPRFPDVAVLTITSGESRWELNLPAESTIASELLR